MTPDFVTPARHRYRFEGIGLCVLIWFAVTTVSAADLLQALAQAEQSDPLYREAQANALATAEGIPQARAQLWLPVLNLTAGGSRSSQEITQDAPFGNDGDVAFNSYDYQVNLTQPVFHRDRLVRLEQANKRLRQAQAELETAYQDLMLRVAERYFDVLAAEDDVQFAAAEKESLAGQLEQARQRFEVGLIAITDVQEARAGYDRALAQEITNANALENAREALREVTGAASDTVAALGDALPLVRPEPDDIEAWTATAMAQNLSIMAAQIGTEVALDEIAAQEAGHYPTLAITGSQGRISQGGRFGQTQIDGGEVGMRFTLPLYAGGSVVSRTRQATHEHAAAVERLERARRAVYRETREAFLGILSQISSINALRQAVLSSRTALDSTRAGFEVGTRTTVDVVTAERGLSEARRDLSRARYTYVVQRLRLKRAAGTLSPDDLAAMNTWLVSGSTAPTTR